MARKPIEPTEASKGFQEVAPFREDGKESSGGKKRERTIMLRERMIRRRKAPHRRMEMD